MCNKAQVAPSGYWRYAAHWRNPAWRCARAKSDEVLAPQIERVWQANMQVYSAEKVWRHLRREGIDASSCTVERSMRRAGLRGVMRGKVVKTTVANAARDSQYVSLHYGERLAEAGEPSVCSEGDSYDNAQDETINVLYKAEHYGHGHGKSCAFA